MPNLYVTEAALKATLTLTGQTFADADITAAIEAASRGIDDVTGRRYYPDVDVNQVRYYTPLSDDVVHTDDIVTLTTVATDDDGDGVFETTWTLNTDFVPHPLNAAADSRPYEWLRRHPASSKTFTAWYPRTVKVTAKFGWAAVPPSISEATTILASKLLRRAREAPFGIIAIGLDQGAAMRIARQDPDVAFLVQPFVRRSEFA